MFTAHAFFKNPAQHFPGGIHKHQCVRACFACHILQRMGCKAGNNGKEDIATIDSKLAGEINAFLYIPSCPARFICQTVLSYSA